MKPPDKKTQLSQDFSNQSSARTPDTDPSSVTPLYPHSSKLFPEVFQSLYRNFFITEECPEQPQYGIENEDDWNPFTIRFDWIAHSRNDILDDSVRIDPALKKNITGFIRSLQQVENTSSPGQVAYVEIDLDKRGGFIAFSHPDDAFLLLRKIIAAESRVHATTDAIVSRNSFVNPFPAQEGVLLEAGNLTTDGLPLNKVNDAYRASLSEIPDQFSNPLLNRLPSRPYASLTDALTVANLVTRNTGKMYIDMGNLSNAIAHDCDRTLACPYSALH